MLFFYIYKIKIMLKLIFLFLIGLLLFNFTYLHLNRLYLITREFNFLNQSESLKLIKFGSNRFLDLKFHSWTVSAVIKAACPNLVPAAWHIHHLVKVLSTWKQQKLLQWVEVKKCSIWIQDWQWLFDVVSINQILFYKKKCWNDLYNLCLIYFF